MICEAYGPELPDHCFFELTKSCGSAAECAERLVDERVRMFGLMQERAAAGDPVMVYLAGEFTAPEQLLGGPGQ